MNIEITAISLSILPLNTLKRSGMKLCRIIA